jgi:hypothetical protein
MELRAVTHAHVIAWSKDLEHWGLSAAGIRRKLLALSACSITVRAQRDSRQSGRRRQTPNRQ